VCAVPGRCQRSNPKPECKSLKPINPFFHYYFFSSCILHFFLDLRARSLRRSTSTATTTTMTILKLAARRSLCLRPIQRQLLLRLVVTHRSVSGGSLSTFSSLSRPTQFDPLVEATSIARECLRATCDSRSDKIFKNYRAYSSLAAPHTDGRSRLDLKHRAETKLQVLADAKKNYAKVKQELESALAKNESKVELQHLREISWQAKRTISDSYSKAIKYVSKPRETDAALRAEQLLLEWISWTGAPATQYPFSPESGVVTAINKFVPSTYKMLGDFDRRALPDVSVMESSLVPSRADFRNVLRAWSSSKARKKGMHAMALLLRMTELSWLYPDLFDTRPDSRTFAMAIQCHSGSTHRDSLKMIVHIHTVHSMYAEHSVPGIIEDDPFLLLASLKSLKNYRKSEECQLGELWLSRLHSFVMDPSSVKSYPTSELNSTNSTQLSLRPSNQERIDLTSAYLKHIREYARLRGAGGSAALARDCLDKMHEINTDGIAAIDIKVNAYNLVIGCYRDSKEAGHATEAIFLLEKMINAWKQSNDSLSENISKVPFPNEKSFEYTIQSLANANDGSTTYLTSMQLLDDFESMFGHDLKPTSRVYSAVVETYAKTMRDDPRLLSLLSDLILRMTAIAKIYPEAAPDVATSSQVLRACSSINGDESERAKAFEKAEKIFSGLQEKESLDNNSTRMSDKCYFHMMKCVANLIHDQDEKQERIKDLFWAACKKGLVSADVLKVFRNQVSDDEFVEKVGQGRIADNWIANVTSSKALYTDGTMGGKGKNARRKGKSTSGWSRKQRKNEKEWEQRKASKAQKKLLKKTEGATSKGRKTKRM